MSKSLFYAAVLLNAVFTYAQAPEAACKVIPGDKDWPTDQVWTKEIPGVVKSDPVRGKITRPDWVVNAKSVEDVQAAVNFAAKHNVRVSIINSGHDFLGRNDAPNGLWINVGNIKGSRVEQSFTPSEKGSAPVDYNKDCVRDINKIEWDQKSQAAITFGTGCSSQDLTDGLDKSNLFMISAAASTVKPSGGFGQMAGHAAFSSKYGLGVDNVLEFKVVTADGKYVIANAATNTDLYNALRGGGGGNWGVVIEATFKAHKTPRIIGTKFWIEAKDKNDTTSTYEPAAYMHSQLPRLNEQSVQGYYYIYPHGFLGRFMIPDSTPEEAKRLWTPIIEQLEEYPGMKKVIYQYQDLKSYKEFFDQIFDKAQELKAGEEIPMEPPAPRGNVPMDSWLIGRATLESSNLAAALKEAMPKMKAGMLRGHLTAGGRVNSRGADVAPFVNPAWRSAMVHIIGTGVGVPNITAIKAMEPNSGSYANEDIGKDEPDWKRVMWGQNYEPLLKIKHQVDPKGVFWVTPGIGADEHRIMNGRLCKVVGDTTQPGNLTMFAPASDNLNPGGGEASYRPFPQTQEECDQHKGACVP